MTRLRNRLPNLVELARKPDDVRYIWALRDEEGTTFSGMTYNGLLKAVARLNEDEEKEYDPSYMTVKIIDIAEDRVITLPRKKSTFEKFLQLWRQNYWNPHWRLKVKKQKEGNA